MKKISKKTLELIIDILKCAISTMVSILGFWTLYGIIWLSLGFPSDSWAIWMLGIVACISDVTLGKWIKD